jgi:hypothetical protein
MELRKYSQAREALRAQNGGENCVQMWMVKREKDGISGTSL